MLDLRPLKLKPSELRLLRDCEHAWTLVSNGHYLPSPRWKNAAERLIERGFLTKADQVVGLGTKDWPPVVLILPANYEAMKAAGAIEQPP